MPRILEDAYAEDDADRILNNHDAIDPDVTDPDEYEEFAPMTFEDMYTEDDADRIPKNHQGYLAYHRTSPTPNSRIWT